MTITNDLTTFYDAEAKTYHQTRKKYRADGALILETLQKVKAKKLSLVELGCGGGRLISLLNEQYQGKLSYTGVDISKELLHYAQKENPKNTFIFSDMVSYLSSLSQESIDAVVACASFQHLPSERERLLVMKNAYRALKYEGLVIFTNWAVSEWFLKTHWKALILSALKSFFTLGKIDWRDMFIPRKTKSWIHYRYYHLFWLKELKKLTEISGFLVEELCFLDAKGHPTPSWKHASNSFLIARKSVFKEALNDRTTILA